MAASRNLQEDCDALVRIRDRLYVNDELQFASVLKQGQLLPKLLLMTNDTPLRESSILLQLIQYTIRRIRENPTSAIVECSSIIALVDPAHLPFCCNFAMVLLDVSLRNTPVDKRTEYCTLLLAAITRFPAFSSQSNSLLPCLSHFMDLLPDCIPHSSSLSLVAEWLFDVACVTQDITKGAAGSLLPGLSTQRVDRLLAKKNTFTATETRILKLQVLRMKTLAWIPLAQRCSLVIALTCDGDPEVAREAGYKLNSLIGAFKDSTEDIRTAAVTQALHLCSPSADRTAAREEVSLSLLDFVAKHVEFSLSSASASLTTLLTSTFLGIDMTISRSKRFQAKLLVLLEAVLNRSAADVALASAIMDVVSSILRGLTISAIHSEDVHAQTIRRMVYRVFSLLIRAEPDRLADCIPLVIILFKLLDVEERDSLVDLYALLEQLRLVYDKLVTPTWRATATADDSLVAAMKKCIASENPKRKLIALSWSRALLGWTPFVLEQMLLLLDDANEDVAKTCASLFTAYQASLSTETASINDYSRVFKDAIERSLLLHPATVLTANGARLAFKTLAVYLQSGLSVQGNLAHSDTVWGLVLEEASAVPALEMLQLLARVPMVEYMRQADSQGQATDDILAVYLDALFLSIILGGRAARREAQQLSGTLLFLLSRVCRVDALSLRRVSLAIALPCLDGDGEVSHLLRILKLKEKESDPIVASNSLYCISCVIECLLVRCRELHPEEDFKRECVHHCGELVALMASHFEQLVGTCDSLAPMAADAMVLYISSLHVIAAWGLLTSALPAETRLHHSDMATSTDTGLLLPESAAKLNTLLDAALALLKRSPPRLAAEIIEFLSHIAVSHASTELFLRIWTSLLEPAVFYGASTVYKFKVAEAVVRMSGVTQQQALALPPLESSFNVSSERPLLAQLLQLVEHAVDGDDSAQRSCGMVLLLVLLNSDEALKSISSRDTLLFRSSQWFTRSLHASDVFLQDICCLGLCRVYALSEATPALATLIADEVISSMTKEKKKAQPVGYAEAGQSTPTAQNPTEQQGRTGAAAPNTATQNALANTILNAQATLAGELGQFLETAARQRVTDDNEEASDRFGVYSTICKVVRKTSHHSLLFLVLSLIRRDPDFLLGEPAALYDAYKTPAKSLTDEQLHKLIPILFLYRYEPVTAVREVMVSLWQAILPKDRTKQLVDTLQHAIIQSLVSSLQSPSWRLREAAALALESFLFTRSWPVLFANLPHLWESGIKALDDIRESTRKAALGFMKVLSEGIVKACNPAESNADCIASCIAYIIPWLLDKGLLEKSQEALGFSFGLLVRIIKSARSNYLKEYIARMVGVLVEAMSALEPQALQYLEFHTQRLNIASEEYQSNRLKVAQESPMQEALDWCLKSLEPIAVPRTLVTLRDALHFGVGLATKVSAAQALSFIAETYPGFVGSSAATVFEFLIGYLLQSAPRMSSLLSAVYTCVRQYTKVVHPEYIDAACEEIIKTYNARGNSDDEDLKSILASVLLQVINGSRDKDLGEATWRKIIRISYIGSFDSTALVAELWTKVFMEALQGSGCGIKQTALKSIHSEVLTVANAMLYDLSWSRRTQGITIIMDTVNSLPSDVMEDCIVGSLQTLCSLLPGQIWSGQDKVFDALTSILDKFKLHIDAALPAEALISFEDGRIVSTARYFTVKTETSEEAMDSGTATSRDWKVSMRGYIQLLQHEATRGTPQYRLAVAVALAELPWSYICSLSNFIFLESLNDWIQLTGIAESQEQRSTPVSSTVGTKAKINAQPRNSLDLFGQRYGSQPVSRSNKKQKSSQPVTELGTEGIGEPLPLESPSAEPVPGEPQNINKTAVEPAFKVKVLEAIAKIWPKSTTGAPESMFATRRLLQNWCFSVAVHEIWSIRRVALVLLGAMASEQVDASELGQLLGCITSSMADTKYSQLRKGALQLLQVLLQRLDKELLLAHKTEIKNLILAGCGDVQPEVIEVASNVQKAFLQIVF